MNKLKAEEKKKLSAAQYHSKGRQNNMSVEDALEGFAVVLLAALAIIGIVFLSGVIHGFVIMKFYGWYVAPLLIGMGLTAPPINIAWAYGLGLLSSWLNYHQDTHSDDRSKEEKINALLQVLIRPAVILLLGWLALSWVNIPS